MLFRNITIEDYKKLIPFWKTNYFVTKMDGFEKFKLFLEKNPGLSILIEDDGNIIGSALGSFDGRRGYLQKVVIAKDLRRRGLGQQLVKKVIKKLRAVDALYIPIGAEEELVPFYKKCGFKETHQVSVSISASAKSSRAFKQYRLNK